jgi:paraquat-inducible protein B
MAEALMKAKPGVVGGFILGAAGLGVAGILFFGGTRMFSRTMQAVAYFSESVAGLEVGSPVTFNGVRIGQVKKVALEFSAATLTARIPVVLEFEPEQITWQDGKRLAEDPKDFERLVRAGLRAQLEMQSFVTGQVRVDLEFDPQAAARLTGAAKGMPEIPTVPSELGQFLAQLSKLNLQDLAQSAQGAFVTLDRFLKHVDSVIDPLAGNANGALIAARQTFRTGDDAIGHLKEEASTALRDLDALLVDVRHQVGPRSAELSQVLNSAHHAVGQASTLLDSLNGLTQPRTPFRSNLEATMRDLAATASSLRDFAATVERNPNAVLLGRSGK